MDDWGTDQVDQWPEPWHSESLDGGNGHQDRGGQAGRVWIHAPPESMGNPRWVTVVTMVVSILSHDLMTWMVWGNPILGYFHIQLDWVSFFVLWLACDFRYLLVETSSVCQWVLKLWSVAVRISPRRGSPVTRYFRWSLGLSIQWGLMTIVEFFAQLVLAVLAMGYYSYYRISVSELSERQPFDLFVIPLFRWCEARYCSWSRKSQNRKDCCGEGWNWLIN